MDDGIIVNLVRHGHVNDYETDVALSELGETQARKTGGDLTTQIVPGERVRFFSSPALRARQTTRFLCDGLHSRLIELERAVEILPSIEVDDRLQNFELFLEGRGYVPIRPLVDIASWRAHKNPTDHNRAQLAFQRAFWDSSDPVAYWLANPGDITETPDAVGDRVRDFVMDLLGRSRQGNNPLRYICVTHSANLRCFWNRVYGTEPGDPPFSSSMTIKGRKVTFLGQTANL